ncbi:MAG: hypothetical protein ACD_51C00065G0007 [uncultured bacterium]|nr:MAG: hypothetical protein ACD_51C00065G0007 [uncultured bacterium]OGJ47725.1 MAG: hypothetical protein A2244_03800 [Candidatus Peregrinibacteria bacterium RIFOXYA2_FULL_41_18]OGJ49436.1 MAG: hypothetical protein A2344_00120 [Candidatus Peregrinibacteria bacterium RIFOXYB12_FULL_41_12]
MRKSLLTGLSFGLTSGIITTLGLIVGLHSGTHSQEVIIGGILTIAIADAFSDALGIHISQESEGKNSIRDIWESTGSTFVFKCLFALTFAVPIMMLPLEIAIWASIAWGLSLLGIFSYFIGKNSKEGKPFHAVAEHMFIAILVIIITHFVGDFISKMFGAA